MTTDTPTADTTGEQEEEQQQQYDTIRELLDAAGIDMSPEEVCTIGTTQGNADNSSEPIRLRPRPEFIDQLPIDAGTHGDHGNSYEKFKAWVDAIPNDTPSMLFGAILDRNHAATDKLVDRAMDDVRQDLGASEDGAVYYSDPGAYWDALDREATLRARYLESAHQDVRVQQALTVAYLEQGWPLAGIARKIDHTRGTVKTYIERLEDDYGDLTRHFSLPHDQRYGRLDQTIETANQLPGNAYPDTETVAEEYGQVFPEDLLSREQWICWELEYDESREKHKKTPKAPWNHGTEPASATDPDNWTDYETAAKYAEMMPGSSNWGVGFSFDASGPFTGIDLDDCRDPDTGDIDSWAWDVIETADSFSQISTSGTGVHVFVRATRGSGLKNEEEGVELYDRNRFFAMTGDHLESTPLEIREQQEYIDDLVDKYMTESEDDDRGVLVEGDDGFQVRRIHSGEAWSPFDAITVGQLYPNLPFDQNIAHPEHGSSTGGNFKIGPDGKTAICWHGQHQFGEGDGCGLNAHHLLAMRALKHMAGENEDVEVHCDEIRHRWANEDKLVFQTWRHTVENEDHIDVDVNPPPYRAIQWADSEFGSEGLDKGGARAHHAFQTAIRILRAITGFDLDLDPETGGSET